MLRIINIAEIIVSLLLVIAILLQNRGTGLGGTFGGSFGGYYTKRGFEKFLVIFSIILSFFFITLALASFLLSA